MSDSAYNRSTPMRHYLYLRVSQKEPFDILYFTLALTCIYNLQDKSFQVMPEITYTGVSNLELRLRAGIIVGPKGSSDAPPGGRGYSLTLIENNATVK